MPIVPAPEKKPADIRQLPHVAGFTISAEEMGIRAWDAVSGAASSLGRAAAGAAASRFKRARELKDAEDVERAATEYLDFADRELNGAVGDDGTVSGGLMTRTGADAAGTAQRWEAAQRRWMDDPSRTYARLTPAQQKLFEQRIAPKAMRFRGEAVQHELEQAEAQRKADTEARALTNRRLAEHAYDKGDAVFGEAAGDYAVAAADRETYGLWRLEPDGSRTYKTPEAKAAWETARDAALDGIRAERAVNLAQRAALADLDDPGAADLLARAEAQAADESLSPESRLRAQEAVARARSARETRAAAAEQAEQAREREARQEVTRSLEQRFEESSREAHADPEAAIRDLFKINAEAGDLADHDKADYYVERLRALTAKRASGEQEARDREESARIVVMLETGLAADLQGRTVYASPQDRIALAEDALIAGEISEGQYKALVAAARRDLEPALERFHRDAMALLLPDLASTVRAPGVIAYDPDTRRHEIVRDAKRPLRFGPESRSGILREYRDESGKRRREHLLMSQLAEALDVFRGRIEADPRYGDRQALEDFKEFIRPSREEYARLTAAEHLAEEASVLRRVRGAADSNRAAIRAGQTQP